MCIKKTRVDELKSNQPNLKLNPQAKLKPTHVDLSFVTFDDPRNRIDKVIVDRFLDFLDVALR